MSKKITGSLYSSNLRSKGADHSKKRVFFENLVDALLNGKDMENIKSFTEKDITVEVELPYISGPITVKTYRKTGKLLCVEILDTITLPRSEDSTRTDTYIRRYLSKGNQKDSIFNGISCFQHGCSMNMNIDKKAKPGYCFLTEGAFLSPFKKTEPRKIFAKDGVLIGYNYRDGRTQVEFRFFANEVNA